MTLIKDRLEDIYGEVKETFLVSHIVEKRRQLSRKLRKLNIR